MLVYGDAGLIVVPRDERARLGRALRRALALPAGIARHGALVEAFIAAGGLAQGIADAAFAEHGQDTPSPAQDAAMAFALALARSVRVSWRTGFRAVAPPAGDALARFAAVRLPGRVRVTRPEGYAFYALYPEAYLAAAAALGSDRGDLRVVGIRSIGTGLAALVATALDAPAPVTVRPVGHPFRRTLALSPELDARLSCHPGPFAVVDEGPGLSGSSFGAVADHLESRGVALERIHFFPGHAGDLGPQASPRHRWRWARTARHTVSFDALVLGAPDPAHRLETWVADLVGTPEAPPEDLSGGAWRRRMFRREADWPPAHVWQERRKIRLRTGSGAWLLRFAGLGREHARKLARGRALHAAGFGTEVVGLRHGFLVERWVDGARPLGRTADRSRLVQVAGRYLGFRARSFAAAPDAGASLGRLLDMARVNTAEALGDDAARRLGRFASDLARLEQRVRRIETDNRLHAWEWLETGDGRLLKTDALDHHAAHDLVGGQDIAWDVVGAAVELDLSEAEERTLQDVIARETGRAVDRGLCAVLLPCYLAFQMGSYALAAQALAGWPEEAARLRAASDRYQSRLADVLWP